MPILTIEVVLDDGAELQSDWAAALASAAGRELGAGPGTCWVRLRGLAREHYAENTAQDGELDAGTRPVFVSILLADLPTNEARVELARRLAPAIAGVLARPSENVHVLFEPAARGRVAFGGRLLG